MLRKILRIARTIAKLPGMLEDIKKRLDTLEQPKITVTGGTINWPSTDTVVFNPNACPQGGMHEYESPWWGIYPPPCKKCGLSAAPGYEIIWDAGHTLKSCTGCGLTGCSCHIVN